MFKEGTKYTRAEINAVLGGSVQSYLPTKGGEVVAACLTDKYNPNAPKVILVGQGPIIESAGKMLGQQLSPIPIFMKRAVNAWEYVGRYKALRYLTIPREMEPYIRASGRSDVVGVLLMEQV
ncbi:hypothetical protein [Citrifermentans bremense]|uniref:DUF6697 domain-containing protein n=1 Tax=Citrifermentans bremense TaxID=60035 RepID=A0A6S6LZM2_9BACT|nr:hypothetical protein [Citrifermentans bremense]